MNNETTCIYVLIDPRDNEVRYVGKSDNPTRRHKAHAGRVLTLDQIKYAPDWRSEKEYWIYELNLEGLRPKLEIIEVCFKSEYKKRERYWIQYYSQDGRWMTNGTILKGTRSFNRLQTKYIKLYGEGSPYSLINNNR